MMEKIKFLKMHGLGNDFIIIENEKKINLKKNLIKNLCNRYQGIGGDLIVFLTKDSKNIADFKAEFFNSDGSTAEICGNALRCVGKFFCDKLKKRTLLVETKSGLIDIETISKEKISVDLGIPKFSWNQIPISRNLDTLNLDLNSGFLKGGAAVNIGNPHLIFFSKKIDKNAFIEHSKKISTNQIFTEGINISVVDIASKKEFLIYTYERGAGLTNACGTGACASVAVANKLNLCDKKVMVNMTGGSLEVEISNDDHILMIGNANEVFNGEFYIERFI